MTIEYDKDLEYLDAEISGFHLCTESLASCDEVLYGTKWKDVPKDKVAQVDSKTITVDLSDFGDLSDCSLSYIWRETPVKELYMLPIYSADEYRVPSPPWKHLLY